MPKHILRVSLFLGLLILLASSCNDAPPTPVVGGDNGNGTLVLVRESKGGAQFEVYMNGNFLGHIGPGETKTFTFSNKAQGNSLVLRHVTEGAIFNSEPLPFQMNPGETINVFCTFSMLSSRPTLERRAVDKSTGISSVKVTIDPKVEMVEASTEIIKVVPGVTTSVKRSRTLDHKLVFSSKDEKGNSIGIKNEFLEAQVKNNAQLQYLGSDRDLIEMLRILEGRDPLVTISQIFDGEGSLNKEEQDNYQQRFDKFLDFLWVFCFAYLSLRTLSKHEIASIGRYLWQVVQYPSLVEYCKSHGYGKVVTVASRLGYSMESSADATSAT